MWNQLMRLNYVILFSIRWCFLYKISLWWWN